MQPRQGRRPESFWPPGLQAVESDDTVTVTVARPMNNNDDDNGDEKK